MAKLKYKVGDEIVVRSGRLKGQSGKITSLNPRQATVTVDGLNVYKRHRKQSQSTPQAGVYEQSMPLPISKIGIAHPSKKGKADRVAYEVDSKGLKKRVYRSNNKEIK